MLRHGEAGYNERLFGGGIRTRFHLARFHWLAKNIQRFAATCESVLELGCFDGRSIHHLPCVPTCYAGFDANWECGLDVARDKWADHPGFQFYTCKHPSEMAQILGCRSYDISLCLETLEHIPPDLVDPYVAVLARVTRQLAFFTVPNEKGPIFLIKHVVKWLSGDCEPYRLSEILRATFGRMDLVRRREHKGFDYNPIIRTLECHFAILHVSGYPIPWLPFFLNFGVGIVGAPHVATPNDRCSPISGFSAQNERSLGVRDASA